MTDDIRDISTRGALIAIAIAALVIATLIGITVFRGGGVVSKSPEKKKYQAVFLTNGQVYFGHLTNVGSSYATLDDVYYIQQGQQGGASPAPAANANNNLSLVKLGQEIHGPERTMQIASNQILFWENLKDDGKVVDAIKKGATNPGDNTNNQGANNPGQNNTNPGNGGNQGQSNPNPTGNQNR